MVRRLFALRAPRVVTPEVGSLFATGQIVEGGVRRSRPPSAGASVNHLHTRAAGDAGSFSPTIFSSSSSLTTGGFDIDQQYDHTSLQPSLQRHGAAIGSIRQLSSSSSTSRSSLLGAEEIEQMKNEIARNGKRMTPEGANDADQLLRQLIEEQMAGNKFVGLDADFINGTLNSYRVLSEKAAERARRGGKRRPDASFAKKADELLAFSEQAYRKDPALSPDVKSYNMVVDAYAKIGEPQRAEAVLMRLEKLWKSGNEQVKPNTILYNSVIDAWAKTGRREAPQRAEAILQQMEELYRQGNEDVCPNTICYSSVINAWAKSREKGAAQRAEAILDHMLKLQEAGQQDCRPNTRSFTAAIDAWARSKDAHAPQRAEALLNKMEELWRQGSADVRPNTISYSAVINTWAKSREKGAARKAEAILNQMLELQESGQGECRPNTICFNAAIDAWARSRDADAPRRAEELLEKMEELYRRGNEDVCPNTISYNAVINAWAKSREKGAAQRAEAILHHMLKLQEGGREECRPDSTSFNSVIDAWAKSGDKNAYAHAQEIFQQMQSIEPSALTYNSLINALAVSSVPDKATKAFDIFLEMENTANVSPDTFTFGAVMKACARTTGNREAKRKALRVALETFDKLRRTSQLASAEPMVYDPLFITIANASKGKEYAKLVTEIFKFCCQDGVLNDWILQNLRRNSPREVFENLIGHHAYGGGDVSVADLPPEWSRNAKMRR